MEDNEERITINDVRKAGHCVSGVRTWFARHGLDFKDFIKNGISAKRFIEAGDYLAQRIVERKRAREESK